MKINKGFLIGVILTTCCLSIPAMQITQERNDLTVELVDYKRFREDVYFRLEKIKKDGHAWCIPLEFIKELKK